MARWHDSLQAQGLTACRHAAASSLPSFFALCPNARHVSQRLCQVALLNMTGPHRSPKPRCNRHNNLIWAWQGIITIATNSAPTFERIPRLLDICVLTGLPQRSPLTGQQCKKAAKTTSCGQFMRSFSTAAASCCTAVTQRWGESKKDVQKQELRSDKWSGRAQGQEAASNRWKYFVHQTIPTTWASSHCCTHHTNDVYLQDEAWHSKLIRDSNCSLKAHTATPPCWACLPSS